MGSKDLPLFKAFVLKDLSPELLFKNGKVICAGAKNEKEIRQALNKAKKMLAPYAEKVRRK